MTVTRIRTVFAGDPERKKDLTGFVNLRSGNVVHHHKSFVRSDYVTEAISEGIVKNKLLPEVVQQKARKELASQPRNASITRVRNRCVLTGRGRGIIGEYGLSRMKFRKLADFGLLSGVTRSSW